MLSLLLAYQLSSLGGILQDPKLDGAIVSATVTDANGKVLFERNGAVHVTPASNMKLLSSAFALYELGPDQRPATRIWKEPNRTIVESTGDPMMTHADLVRARDQLSLDRRLPVYVRQEYAPLWGDNWEIGDLPNKYAAPVCAFTVDRGSFEVWSQRGRAEFRPEAYGTRAVRTALPKDVSVQYDPFSRVVRVAPEALLKDRRLDTLSLPRPDEAAACVLGSSMRSTEDTPRRAPDLIIEGPKVADILAACLPPSDNQLAEHLLLMGARAEGPLGQSPYTVARLRLTNFLVRVAGLDRSDVRVDDGSGLSRHNFVTTRALAKLLLWCSRQPTAPQWEAALAHSGKGTLANRLKELSFAGKTGSLDMVTALSGYVTTKSGERRIVSLVMNGFGCSSTEAKAMEDRFYRAVAELDPPSVGQAP